VARRQGPAAVGLLGIRAGVIDEHQIDIGGCRHFPAAELAHGNDGASASRHAAMLGFEIVLNFTQHAIDEAFGEHGIRGTGILGADRARQKPHADEKRLFAADDAGGIEYILHRIAAGMGARLLKLAPQQLVDLLLVGVSGQHAGIEHGVEQPPPPRQDAGKPRCRPHNVGDEPHQIGIGFEQRKKLHACRQLSQKLIEACNRAVRIDRIGERGDE